MEMDDQLNNGFCPKCGALLRDGVCPSCGYGENNGQEGAEGGVQPRNYERYQASMNQNMNQDMNQNSNQNTSQNGYYQNNADSNNLYYQNQNGYGGQQNMYYQQPGANNYYGNQPPEQKKSKKGVVIAVVIAVVLCIALIVAAIALVISAAGKDTDTGSSSQDLSSLPDYDVEDYIMDDDELDAMKDLAESGEDDADDEWDSDAWDDEGGSYDEDLLAFVDEIDWSDTSWKEEPENYTPDEVYDDYYECYISLCSCMDENVSYDMVYNNWEELDEEKNVCIRVNYYQLEGDIPNLDEINEELRFQAAWPGDIYFDMADDFAEEFEEYGPGYVVSVESYVTYNDEEKISVVSDIYYESATSVRKLLYGVNIDLTTGEIMKNNRMLDVTDEFLEEYKDICEYQNGTVSIFDELDNDELREFFEDRDDVIIYYTPCGLEVGINYETEERYGWVSATLVDYEQYLK